MLAFSLCREGEARSVTIHLSQRETRGSRKRTGEEGEEERGRNRRKIEANEKASLLREGFSGGMYPSRLLTHAPGSCLKITAETAPMNQWGRLCWNVCVNRPPVLLLTVHHVLLLGVPMSRLTPAFSPLEARYYEEELCILRLGTPISPQNHGICYPRIHATY